MNRAFKILSKDLRSGPNLQHQWTIGQKHTLKEPLEAYTGYSFFKNGLYATRTLDLAKSNLPVWFASELDNKTVRFVEVEMSGTIIEEFPGRFVCTEMTILNELTTAPV